MAQLSPHAGHGMPRRSALSASGIAEETLPGHSLRYLGGRAVEPRHDTAARHRFRIRARHLRHVPA